jgi:threonine aldolase
VVVGREAHIYQYEAGGLAVLGGLVPLVVDDRDGIPACDEVATWCRPPDPHAAPARLLCLENTHNRAGGLAVPPDRFRAVALRARDLGLAVHLDGARLFNATVRWTCDASAYSSVADSVQICLSKGLAAPVGSVLCGAAEFIDRARHWRKRLGGGLRQAGIVAAPGRVALQTMRDRLGEDHAHAALLADRLTRAGVCVEDHAWRTNMVFVRVPATGAAARDICRRCADHGIAIGAMGPGRLRLVTHAGVTRADVERAAAVVAAALTTVG